MQCPFPSISVCACALICVCVCAHVCMHVCVHVCARAHVCVHLMSLQEELHTGEASADIIRAQKCLSFTDPNVLIINSTQEELYAVGRRHIHT